LDDLRSARPQQVAFHLTREIVRSKLVAMDGAPKPWLFPFVLEVTREWMRRCLVLDPGAFPGLLMLPELGNEAAEQIENLIVIQQGNRTELLRPMLRQFDGEGSTDEVRFVTRKPAIETIKSPVSHVVLDGPTGGNTWEEKVAGVLETHSAVAAYVKNDHLGFDIPYVHQGRSHRYVPDFLARLVQSDDDPFERILIFEVSGSRKSPGPTKAKAATARDQWCTAVNNHGGFGRWGYAELNDIFDATGFINDAINNLYADAPIIGTPV
jgi:type III restriction enzyme